MNLGSIIYSLVWLYPHQIAESIDYLGTRTGHSINRHFFVVAIIVLRGFFFFLNTLTIFIRDFYRNLFLVFTHLK